LKKTSTTMPMKIYNKNETKDGFVSHIVELRERLIHSFIF